MSWAAVSEVARVVGIARQSLHERLTGCELRRIKGRGAPLEVRLDTLPPDLATRYLRARATGSNIYSIEAARRTKSLAALDKVRPEARAAALARARVVDLAAHLLVWPKGQRGRETKLWLDRFNRGQIDAQALQDAGGPISERTLDRWRKQLREGGLAELVDRRGRPANAALASDMGRFCEDCILAQPLITGAKTWRLLRFQFTGRKIPSQRTVARFVAKFKADNKALLTNLSRPSIWKRWYQISLGRADADLTEPNQRWEIDSTRGDIMTADGKRCTIILCVDVWTRRPVIGIYERGGGANINQLLHKAFRTLGIPAQIIMDRGKDYQSTEVQACCLDLGIDCPEIPGYSPELKPHAEIGFHVLSDLLHVLTGYTANKLAVRPETIPTKHTLAELQELVDKWVIAHESEHVHSGIGCTPRQRWMQAWDAGWRPETVADEALRILLKPPVERSITQGRIRYQGGDYTAPELDVLEQSSRVMVRPDPDDAGILYVFDDELNFICLAKDLRLLALSPEDIAKRRKHWQGIRKMERKAARARALDLDEIQGAMLDAAVEAAEDLPELPAPTISLPEIDAAAQARAVEDEIASEAEAKAAEPDARPFFTVPVERYEWVITRWGAGIEPDEADRAFVADFERSRLWKLNGGPEYRRRLLGSPERGLLSQAG